LPEANPQRFEL